MPNRQKQKHRGMNRRGAILVLTAILMVAIFGFVAMSLDVGYMTVVRNELQNATDAAALAGATELMNGAEAVKLAAKSTAQSNKAGGVDVALNDAEIELGYYNLINRTFTAGGTNLNAVRVVAHVVDKPLFFAPVIKINKFQTTTEAIAMLNPRDICFCVDLSGSMNDDTEPAWATAAINSKFAPSGFPTIGNTQMANVYTDFGLGAYPGTLQYIGAPLGVTANSNAYAEMTKDDGPLTSATIPAAYRILNNDSEVNRKKKAYSWMIDKQIAVVMPSVKPTPSSTANYDYWERYLDYILISASVGTNPPSPPSSGGGSSGGGSSGGGSSGGGGTPAPKPPSGFLWPPKQFDLPEFLPDYLKGRPRNLGEIAGVDPTVIGSMLVRSQLGAVGVPRNGSTLKVTVPPNQNSNRITGFNNPNTSTFPGLSSSGLNSYRNKIGPLTYVQFMMDFGRDRAPTHPNGSNASPSVGTKVPLSRLSPECPYHSETTAGGSFSFPPREQPMHAVRRSLIAALQAVKEQNEGVNSTIADHVSIVSFDAISAFHAPKIEIGLTGDYTSAMTACTKLQAVADIGNSTAMENGIIKGRAHIAPTDLGGSGRKFTTKVMVLLTDGVPNVWQSADNTINNYASSNPSADYYSNLYPWYNSVLVQSAQMQAEKTLLFPVGVGLGCDYGFMDRISRMNKTDTNGQSPRGSGNPAEYEQRLTDIFKDILKTPNVRLVK